MSESDLPIPNIGVENDNGGMGLVHNELLCFVQQKSGILTVEDVIKVCLDFYKKEDVLAARQLLDTVISKRLSRRQGPDMIKSTVEDIVKCVLDPSNNLPVYCAINLNRLPAVNVKHCDITAILVELKELRAEVRDAGMVKVEIEDLRKQVSDCLSLKLQVAQLQEQLRTLSDDRERVLDKALEPLNIACDKSDKPLYSDLVKLGRNAEATKTKPPAHPLVIGASSKQSRVKAVITKRNIDVFVSRLHPDTDESEIRELVREIVPQVQVEDIQCTRLQSKYSELYCSFYIAVRVNVVEMSSHIDMLLAADLWPAGLLVRRYFQPKHSHGDN